MERADKKTKKKKRPARRPAPKGDVLATSRGKSLIELPGPEPREMRPGAGVSKQSRHNFLRARAGTLFMVDPSMPTVADIANHPDFAGVKEQTVRHWATADNWADKRASFRESVNAGVRKRIGNKLIQQQIKILEDCDTIYQRNLEYLTGGGDVPTPEPKSYESLLRAHTGFTRLVTDIGREMVDVVVPPTVASVESEGEVSSVTPELSPDEARVAALAVVQRRRQLQSESMQKESDKEEE